MPRKFWMGWVQGTPTTEKRHPTYQLAYEEADKAERRLSKGRNKQT